MGNFRSKMNALYSIRRKMVIYPMIRKLFTAFFSLLLLSCLSIETKMTLAANGSGTLDLVYTVSPLANDWNTGANSPLPLPINENDFRRSVTMIQGLGLVSYSRSVDKDVTIIRATISFTSLDVLNRLVSGQETTFRLRTEGNRTIFEQTITQGTQNLLNADNQAFVQAFFQPYSLSFSLTAPRAIQSVTPEGNSSGQNASVTFPLPRIIESPRPIIWRVEW